ncbi:O-antigen ligase family protein [Erwinia sp. AnSW2-5]|uniref:O-antigen ligase family protein n=1 Tax=Erwinia sp. AnSW2-5 TaxID=3367692 RepID=UPI00385D4E8D
MVLAVPLAYTTDVRFAHAAWRIATVISGLALFFSLLQLRWCRGTLLVAVYGGLLLITVEAVIATQQLLRPLSAWVPMYSGRIYGTFFQPNVLASFLATGIALSLALLLLPSLALSQPRYERLRQASLHLLLLGLSALLVCIQSRAGWLGGVAATLILLRFGRLNTLRTTAAIAAVVAGVILGASWLYSGQSLLPLTDHTFSNQARWTMLRDTLAMIADKPWLGWGYGGFEYDFQHFRLNQSPPVSIVEIARHPHNEILFWVVEGGLITLVGVILILYGLWTLVRQAIRRDRLALASDGRLAGVPTALCIIALPMAIHTQLEFPFYLSTLHFVVFLLLLAAADRLSEGAIHSHPLPTGCHPLLPGVMAAMALSIALLAGFAIRGQQVLREVESFAMEDVTPLKTLPPLSRLILQERITFDEQVGGLMRYNHTQDEYLLEDYRDWAQDYLQRRIDKNVYASLIQVLHHQKQHDTAGRYRREAALLFPQDARFASAAETEPGGYGG